MIKIETPRVVRLEGVKPVGLEFIEPELRSVPHIQEEHNRVLFYNRDGKLSTIVFDSSEVDLRDLPQDEVIPTDLALVELFNAHGIIPQVAEDLVPDLESETPAGLQLGPIDSLEGTSG